MSVRGRQHVVAGGHWIHLDQPDLVVSAIEEVIALAGRRETAGIHLAPPFRSTGGDMDHPDELRRRHEEDALRRERQSAEHEPQKPGDVLGIGDAEGEIPAATSDRGGHPEGIEVRERTTGTADLQRGKGATGIDMGHGGKGTGINPDKA
jgi:hypothetical protein